MENIRITIRAFILIFAFFSLGYSQQIIVVDRFDEKELKDKFEKFISRLDSASVARKYPEITRKILSSNPSQQAIALRMLSESEDVNTIPWAILLLDSDDKYVQTYAGLSIQKVVSSITLKRRDSKYPQYVLIKRIQKDDVELKPLAWIILKLLRSENPNLSSHGVATARYLNLYEFEDEILKLSKSPHPAVSNTVKWAIESFILQKKYESNESLQSEDS